MTTMSKETSDELVKQHWTKKLQKVKRDEEKAQKREEERQKIRRNTITDAIESKALSYLDVSKIMKLHRQRVIQIVKEERHERASRNSAAE